jgi:DHA1 family bicyclomycin/chloramphenicol resistance-like MFS transporter
VTSIGNRKAELILLLGAVTAFAPMSIDMYLPALPLLGMEFGATAGHVQLSVASFFLGLAVGQGFYGPLSDRFGRTRPLYAGLLLFVLASIGCALAPTVDFLIVVRFFQALGACSGQVIARAVVRDLFEPREAVQVYSLLVW